MKSPSKHLAGDRRAAETIVGRNVGPYPRHSFLHCTYDLLLYKPPLWIKSGGDDEWVEGCFRRRTNSTVFVLEFVYAGTMLFRNRGHEYLAEPGDVFLLHMGSTTEMETGPMGFCRKIPLFLVGPLLPAALRETGLSEIDLVRLRDPVAFLAIANQAIRHMKSPAADTGIRLSTLAYEALATISASSGERHHPASLLAAMDLVQQRLAMPLRLPEMCAEAGVSVSTMSRLFRAHLGVSPMEYVIRQRMDLATHLLATTSLSVKEIAVRAGYENQLYFSSEFHKHRGVSPSRWRARHGA